MTEEAADVRDADTILREARAAYERAREWWSDNHAEAKEDLAFARLGRQWDERIRQQRELEQRPCLTFNKMPAFIRQVVNDARQNKPAIKVHPQDSNADPRTAEIINGLIRNIETSSDADVAYDTAIESAVDKGFGFWRINTRYTSDDAFDQDIVIERIANPFTVYGDPRSQAADSSDWNVAFVVTTMSKDAFEREYPDAEKKDWEADFRGAEAWLDGDSVVVAEYWTREKVRDAIVALADGSVLALDDYEAKAAELARAGIAMVGTPREVDSTKVTQRIMSGAEILKEIEWAGKYIPIIPVYGDEVIDEEGKRHFRSLIRDAKSAQQMFNYWRTTTTELVALAPKGAVYRRGARVRARSQLEQREQPIASLSDGADRCADPAAPTVRRRAARRAAGGAQRRGRHEIDHRHLRCLARRAQQRDKRPSDIGAAAGRRRLDLPLHRQSVARDPPRRARAARPDPEGLHHRADDPGARRGPQAEQRPDRAGRRAGAAEDRRSGHDHRPCLRHRRRQIRPHGRGGPSYTTRREEVTTILTEVMRSVPDSAVFLAGRLARLLDLPDAEQLGREMDMLNPAKQRAEQQSQQAQQGQQGGARQQAFQAVVQQLQQQLAAAQDKAEDRQIDAQMLAIEQYRAETERMKVAAEMARRQPEPTNGLARSSGGGARA